MIDFFKYYTEIDKKIVFNNFDYLHVISMIIVLSLILLGLKIIKNIKKESAKKLLRVLAILVPAVEFSHTYWLYKCGITSISKLLPFHICALNIFFIPLSVFTTNVIIKEYTYAYSIIGGFLGIVCPSGVSGSYPIFHYQTIQTFIYHGLLIFIPIAMCMIGEIKPNYKNLYKVHIIFIIIAVFVGTFDYVFDENYMFIKYPPEVKIVEVLYKRLGDFWYSITHLVVCVLGSYISYIPFIIKNCKLNTSEKSNDEIKDNIEGV